MSGISEACVWNTIDRYDPDHLGVYGGGAALNLLLASVGIGPQPTYDVDGTFPQAMAAALLAVPGARRYQDPRYPEFTVRVPADQAAGLGALDAAGDDALYSQYMRDASRLRTVTGPNGARVFCMEPASIYFATLRGRQNLTKTESTVEAAHRAGLLDEADFETVIGEYLRLLKVKIINSHDRIAQARRDYGLAS
jgi:hypothetical protein